MLLTIFVFLVTLSTLIICHELGHFLVAKKTGIKVEEFGLGYPPRIVAKKVGQTIYSLNLIPFGGFVRLLGQDEIKSKKTKGAFWTKSKKVRMAVTCAGVLANLFLAWILFSLIYLIIGIPTKTNRIVFEAVIANSPADMAGIKPGDVLLALNGDKLNSIDDFVKQVETKKGETVTLSLERNGKNLTVSLTPRQEVPEQEGPLGVVISNYEMKKYSFWQMPARVLIEGGKETYNWLITIFTALIKMVSDLIFAGQVPKDIAGPIGIFQVTANVARSGFVAVLQFIAILSVNLAIINILPFPALDGGRFIFILYEVITGRRSPEQVERWVHNLGMFILLFLMLLVTINDVKRLVSESSLAKRLESVWPF